MELCSMLCGSLDGRGVWGRTETYLCMAEPFCSSPETIATLLISNILTQNKKLKKKTTLNCYYRWREVPLTHIREFKLCFWLRFCLILSFAGYPIYTDWLNHDELFYFFFSLVFLKKVFIYLAMPGLFFFHLFLMNCFNFVILIFYYICVHYKTLKNINMKF